MAKNGLEGQIILTIFGKMPLEDYLQAQPPVRLLLRRRFGALAVSFIIMMFGIGLLTFLACKGVDVIGWTFGG